MFSININKVIYNQTILLLEKYSEVWNDLANQLIENEELSDEDVKKAFDNVELNGVKEQELGLLLNKIL